MRRGGNHLLGRHDFSAFRSSGCGAKTPVRNLKALTVRKNGEFVEITLEADAFLMHMARNIVGTLVDVGLGRCPGDAVQRVLLSRDRSKAGRTAPAYGLYLRKVYYP
jgi:tRNA pseudouridine38-40 synthase